MKVLVAVFALVALTHGLNLRLDDEQCDPETETECPNGCCPELNWFCCWDSLYCHPTAADCPWPETRLIKMSKKNQQCDPETETDCPKGCCPELNWFCCPELYCAETEEDCP
jgi:hypothetical protein